jgi:hypothetical protein
MEEQHALAAAEAARLQEQVKTQRWSSNIMSLVLRTRCIMQTCGCVVSTKLCAVVRYMVNA